MPMGEEELLTLGMGDGVLCFRIPEHVVVCHAGELKDHLVHFCLAVASDSYDLILYAVQHRYDLFRSIVLGQVISRSVIEEVSQKDDSVGALLLYLVHEGAAPSGGTVDIGSNQKLHGFSSALVCFLLHLIVRLCSHVFSQHEGHIVPVRKHAWAQIRSLSVSARKNLMF